MITVLNCITADHDLRLVTVAAIICALSSFTTVMLLQRAQRTKGHEQILWLGGTACVSGFGIWATHFLAMIAFKPEIPSGFDTPLTALSLGLALIVMAAAFAVRLRVSGGPAGIFAGALVGTGIASMHYVGMAGFLVEGRILWSNAYIFYSISLGIVFASLALFIFPYANSFARQLLVTTLLIFAICGVHFFGMAAVRILPDPNAMLPEGTLPMSGLAGVVGAISFLILTLSIISLRLDARDRAFRSQVSHMYSLADAAVEGLLIYGPSGIVIGNRRLANLLDVPESTLPGRVLSDIFAECQSSGILQQQPDTPYDAVLVRSNGDYIPVELVLNMVELGGKRVPAISVRDLRRQREAEEQIRFLADYDPLTKLANRRHFHACLNDEIRRARIECSKFAVMCMDLDRFKEVNDLHGHPAGDALLRHFAQVVSSTLESGQMMARLGGDEFAILLPRVDSKHEVHAIVKDVLAALCTANAESTAPYGLSSSVGVSFYPDDALNIDDLIAAADTALYRAKSEARGSYRFFEVEMGEQVRARRLLEQDLRSAAGRGEFSLVYQPQLNVKSGEVIGLEALLRWNSPQRGHVSPDQFIPVAEECGAIVAIGEWVLRSACAEAAGWRRHILLAVNVSAVQVNTPGFAHRVHEILLETGLSPSRLELEITETALVQDFDRALATLRQLKNLGIKIVMDDFGTGYSSLYNLRAFPFDKIKIDRSFVKAAHANQQGGTIVRAVLGIGRGLGVPVLAEGVETQEELKFLSDESCEEVQGYLMGRPVSIECLHHITQNGQIIPFRSARLG